MVTFRGQRILYCALPGCLSQMKFASTLGPVLFNIFIGDAEEAMKYLLLRFAQMTVMNWDGYSITSRPGLLSQGPRQSGRIGQQKPTGFNKGKSKALCYRRNNSSNVTDW